MQPKQDYLRHRAITTGITIRSLRKRDRNGHVELLAVILDVEGKKTDADAPEERLQADFVVEAAKGASELFAKEVLPRVVNEVSGWDEDDASRWGARRLWQGIGSRFYDSTSALEIGLEVALEQLARDNPDALDAISGPAE